MDKHWEEGVGNVFAFMPSNVTVHTADVACVYAKLGDSPDEDWVLVGVKSVQVLKGIPVWVNGSEQHRAVENVHACWYEGLKRTPFAYFIGAKRSDGRKRKVFEVTLADHSVIRKRVLETEQVGTLSPSPLPVACMCVCVC